jgi:hypothetical protein
MSGLIASQMVRIIYDSNTKHRKGSTNVNKHQARQDSTGLTVVVTAFPKAGLWGIRILRWGQMLWQTSVDRKRLIGVCIAEELRMLNKCGYASEMADAARDRLSKKPRPTLAALEKRDG